MKNFSKEMTFRANERFVFIRIFDVLPAYSVQVRKYKLTPPRSSVGWWAGRRGNLELKSEKKEGLLSSQLRKFTNPSKSYVMY